MKKTIWEILAKEPILHDSTRKELALKFVESRQGTCTYQEVADKYLLEKRVLKQGEPGKLTKYGYYAGKELVMEMHDA